MIRRGIVFLLLVGVGLVALNLAIGGEDFAGSSDRQTPPMPREAKSIGGGGVQIGAPGQEGDGETPPLSLTIGGRMSIPRSRTVKLGEGTRELPIYVLKCEDSEPISEELFRMVNVTVDFFEVGGTADNPIAVQVVQLVADEAFVQLGVDEHGRASIDEDKEMRVLGAVLRTTDQARAQNVTLMLDEALALVSEDGVRMHTPDDLMPFRLTSTGDQPWEITGNGLEAWLPGQGGRVGDQIRIDVHSNPELLQTTTGGVTHLSARGKLSLRQDPGDGATVILMEDDVRITMEGGAIASPGNAAPQGSFTASGQRLRAHLARSEVDNQEQGSRGQAQWQRIWLDGDPAILTGNGAELRCNNLEITPGPTGQPYMFSATGAPAVMDYTDKNGLVTHVKASHRIHLLRPGNHLGPLFTGFGFPLWSLGPLNRTEIMVFEGATVMDQGSDLHLSSSEGLWLTRQLLSEDWLSLLLQPGRQQTGGPLAMHGRGDVEVILSGDGPELHLEGNMGLALTVVGDTKRIRVGPAQVSGEHRYFVQRGELELEGVGLCEIAEAPDRVTVRLRAPGPQIEVGLGDRGSLADLNNLDAAIVGGELESFFASGPVCRISWGRAGEEVNGTAQEIESLDPNSFHLSGTVTSPATAHYRPTNISEEPAAMEARDVFLSGADIWIHRISDNDVLLEASAPAPSVVRLQLQVAQENAPPMHVDLHGQRIRLLPFAVSPAALQVAAMGLPQAIRELFARNMRSPYLIAEHRVSITQREEAAVQTAFGDFLLLAVDSQSGFLTGSPANLERRDDSGQAVTGIAERINLQSGPDGQFLELVATDDLRPELHLVDPSGSLQNKGGEPSRFKIISTGNIRVLPEAVRFDGLVEMQSLAADGTDDPDGAHLTADNVSLDRDPETGEILQIHASGNVRLEWSGVTAWGTKLTLDPKTHFVTVSDPNRNAGVELSNGLRYRAGAVHANYESFRVQSWAGRVDGGGRGR